jgi:hypothetical protein
MYLRLKYPTHLNLLDSFAFVLIVEFTNGADVSLPFVVYLTAYSSERLNRRCKVK